MNTIEQLITNFMQEVVVPNDKIPTLTRKEAYELWNKAVYVTSVADVWALKLLDHYKKLSRLNEPKQDDLYTKLIAGLSKKGIKIEDIINSLSEKS